MNRHLQLILDVIKKSATVSEAEKDLLIKAAREADKELEIADFKLSRTEKVKRTTAILLEETIAELEQKRRSVEIQNRELEIEACLERVRSSAMAMQKTEDLNAAVAMVFEQLAKLELKVLRCGIGIVNK